MLNTRVAKLGGLGAHHVGSPDWSNKTALYKKMKEHGNAYQLVNRMVKERLQKMGDGMQSQSYGREHDADFDSFSLERADDSTSIDNMLNSGELADLGAAVKGVGQSFMHRRRGSNLSTHGAQILMSNRVKIGGKANTASTTDPLELDTSDKGARTDTSELNIDRPFPLPELRKRTRNRL